MVFEIYHGSWYFGRPWIEGIARGSKAVLKKVPAGLGHRHPDLITAWEWGEKDRFGKSYAKVFREQE